MADTQDMQDTEDTAILKRRRITHACEKCRSMKVKVVTIHACFPNEARAKSYASVMEKGLIALAVQDMASIVLTHHCAGAYRSALLLLRLWIRHGPMIDPRRC
jgi:hypothetical protein